MGVIFDLDQTLIDSSSAEPYRRVRNWQKVYGMIPSLNPYEGIDSVIQLLNKNNIPIAIVTSSPKSYCDKIVNHWKWQIKATVGYHCTNSRKPDPEPIFLAMKLMGVQNPNDVISIGDHSKDIIASKAAKVFTIGCTWGIRDNADLIKSGPDIVVHELQELQVVLTDKLKLN